MAETIIDWNATNWATVIFMVVVAFLIFGILVNLYKKWSTKNG
ncbi:MAG: hypothetical protein QXV17_07595 [Candidatus Micrarchaeaceae archaeon]